MDIAGELNPIRVKLQSQDLLNAELVMPNRDEPEQVAATPAGKLTGTSNYYAISNFPTCQ